MTDQMLAELLQKFYKTYDALFSRKILYKWHRFLYNVSLRGMGILINPTSPERYFLKKFFASPEKKIVFDVGANVGHYAEKIKKYSIDAEVFCFEPHPRTFAELENKSKTLNIQVFPYACAAENGRLKFYDYAGKDGGSTEHASVFKEVIEGIHKKESIEYEVKCIRIDDFADRENIRRIDLLKVDTEGFEMEVLKGASTLLSEGRIGTIQIEFNEMNVISRSFLRDFIQFLPEYKFYRMIQDGFIPINKYVAVYHEIFAFQNILAVHKSSAFKL